MSTPEVQEFAQVPPYVVQLADLHRDRSDLATLQDLEEASYKLVQDLGDAEWKLIEVLAAIRDSGQWQASYERFDEYLREWAIEASNRLPHGRGLPLALRTIQMKLAIHRRLVDWAGMEPQEVLGQPYYVMDNLCRRLGRWDYKTGEPTLTDQAHAKLVERFGEADDRQLVQEAVLDVARIAIPGDALRHIAENYGPPVKDQTIYELTLNIMGGIPEIHCHVQRINQYGRLTEDRWFLTDAVSTPWPDDAIQFLAHKLGVQATERG
jgi:hypothetical protein